MKKLLILLLISICVIGWRSETVLHGLARIGAVQASRQPSLHDMLAKEARQENRPMSLEEFAALAQKDPAAYQKFLQSRQVEEERNEVDKFMNLLAHGKYE